MLSISTYSATYDCNTCNSCNTAISNSVSGDLIRLTSDINQDSGSCIDTQSKTDFTIDCQNHLITGDGSLSYYGIEFKINTNDVSVNNCRIEDFGKGIYLFHADNNSFDNLNLQNNYQGFSHLYSNKVIITNSIMQENKQSDYYFSPYGFIDCDNTISNLFSNGREILYANSQVNLNNDEYASVILCDADDSTLTDIDIMGSDNYNNNGLYMYHTDNTNLIGINSTNNSDFRISQSTNNLFEDIYVTNNTQYGIFFDLGSNDNILKNSYFSQNSQFVVYIRGDNNIVDNTIIERNFATGIFIQGESNTIANSTLIANYPSGISVQNSNNLFYNNILANTINYEEASGTTNYLNKPLDCSETNIVGGSCSGGNYWSKLTHLGLDCATWETNYVGICYDNTYFWKAEKNHSELCMDGDANGICDSIFDLSVAERSEIAIDNYPLKGNIFGQSLDYYELFISDNSDINTKVGDDIVFSADFRKNSAYFGEGTCKIFVDDVWENMINTGISYNRLVTVTTNEMLEYYVSCYEDDVDNHLQKFNSFFVNSVTQDDTTNNLAYLNSKTGTSRPFTIIVEENYAYVGSEFKGIEIYDISNPNNVVKTDDYTLSSGTYPVEIEIHNDIAYVLLRDSSFMCFDISDKYNIQVLCDYTNTDIEGGFNVEVDSNIAYLTSYYTDSLYALDISDLNSITVENSYTDPIILNGAYKLKKVDNYLYVLSSYSNTLSIFDVSNPSNMQLINTYNDASFQVFKDIKQLGSNLFILAKETVVILDISNPTNPTKVSELYSQNFNWSSSIEISDLGYLFVSSNGLNQITVVDITNINSPSITETFTNRLIDGVQDTYAYQNKLYTANLGADSISIFDASYYVAENNHSSQIVSIPSVTIDYTPFNSSTTDFSTYTTEELADMENVIFANTYGKIEYTQNISVISSIILTNKLKIENNRIEVNSALIPQFNKPAILEISGITYTEPIIYQDTTICPSNICQLISYENNIVRFSVTGFSYYTIKENTTEVITPPVDGGTSSGGGGGSSSSSPEVSYQSAANVCNIDYTCSNWGSCIGGVQTRTCEDANECSSIIKTESQFCSDSSIISKIIETITNITTEDYIYYYADIDNLNSLYTFFKKVPDKFIIVDKDLKKQYLAILNFSESTTEKVYSILEIKDEESIEYVKELGLETYDFNKTTSGQLKVIPENKDIDKVTYFQIALISIGVIFLISLFLFITFRLLSKD
ncbi:MAG: right-handed parallel beta-helix repeat-containing protein [Candidatus Woesearchaeota archaeon]|nr:right-handed parallel beta-helix repeat-containing protein [Candidatus Woesearchaeota archaeon]